MERGSKFLILCSAILGIIVQFAGAQNVHIVGDGLGWRIPPNNSAYPNWATGKTFMLGDILVFNFATNTHDVARVPEASYDSCTGDNVIGDIITTGPGNMTLNSSGNHYFICTFGTHCQAGQKLAITVGSSTTPAAPTPPMTPTTPSPPTPRPNNDSASSSLLTSFLIVILSAVIAFLL